MICLIYLNPAVLFCYIYIYIFHINFYMVWNLFPSFPSYLTFFFGCHVFDITLFRGTLSQFQINIEDFQLYFSVFTVFLLNLVWLFFKLPSICFIFGALLFLCFKIQNLSSGSIIRLLLFCISLVMTPFWCVFLLTFSLVSLMMLSCILLAVASELALSKAYILLFLGFLSTFGNVRKFQIVPWLTNLVDYLIPHCFQAVSFTVVIKAWFMCLSTTVNMHFTLLNFGNFRGIFKVFNS